MLRVSRSLLAVLNTDTTEKRFEMDIADALLLPAFLALRERSVRRAARG